MRTALAVVLLVLASFATAQERALNKEAIVPAPVEAVWQAWTTRDGIVSFFAPDAEIEPRVGGAFHVHMDPLAQPGMKGADEMRFMALQPPSMLSFDWNAPPHLAQVRQQRTFVVVRFKDIDGKSTKVTLHHTGWGDGGEWDQTYAYFDRAWGNVLGNLKKRFESGPVDWTDWMARLRKFHEQPPVAKP
ncbi:SRPBCC domain-containing protein [Rhizobacter sp. AJA081-3]|uniref:SRPBCC family protein n=1 Tax=Rhizobacter sp. AJA081-3 TaxID=2753607 RepID=UPI001AE0A924|nr:SRPBCC domain-containing protein [Rhizobacter sp. AJA081-3]QTN23133.1 SRPBCC domain-containing protein [Rhizobacter sp. AJA081-3]